MRPEPPYDGAKNHPNRLTPRDFLAKKPKSPLPQCWTAKVWNRVGPPFNSSTNVRRYPTHHRWHFYLSGRQCTGAHALCMQHSPTAAALSTSFLLNHVYNSPKHWLQDLGSHTAAWVQVLNQKDWRSQAATNWILAMHWSSIWVKKWDFHVSPFCQVLQKHKLFIWGGIVKRL